MAIITLTTDLGLKDYYVGSVKGAILSQFPEAQIVDITHLIKPFDILQASIVIRNCYRDFPEGTVHIIGISPEAGLNTRHLAMKVQGQYFIADDNGIFSLIFDSAPDELVELSIPHASDMLTFPTKDVFVTAACHLARGGSLEVIGKPVQNLIERTMFRAVSEENLIRGIAVYVDHYGNVLTNIDQQLFLQHSRDRDFVIHLRRSEYEIRAISRAYSDVPGGEKLALFNSAGFLEIAINKGNAHQLLGINQSDIIRIEFDAH